MKNNILYWSLTITLGIVTILSISRIITYFQELLKILIELFKLTDTTPEFKIILTCISIWVNCKIFDTIANIIFKLHSLIKNKI